jgi:hypothetical protein
VVGRAFQYESAYSTAFGTCPGAYEEAFSVGTMVYMKLKPCVQSSVMPRANQKLSFKYFGSFRIAERVGLVAYRLKLPKHSEIHPIVHVSQLKLVAGFKGRVSSELPADSMQFRVPLQILGSRMVSHGTAQVSQVLVRWSELPDDLATWEDLEGIQQRLPATAAWGQVGIQDTGNVSTTIPTGVQMDDSIAGPHHSTRPMKTMPMCLAQSGCSCSRAASGLTNSTNFIEIC